MVAKVALGLGDEILKAAVAGEKASPSFSAWHGTPATFKPVAENPLGAFNFDMMRSGKGTQAYGSGTYLSDIADKSRRYRGRESERDQALFDDLKAQYDKYANKTDPSDADYERMKVLEQILLDGDTETIERLGADYFGKAGWNFFTKSIQPTFQREASLYKVNVKPSKEEMIFWDGTIDDQDEPVKKALQVVFKELDEITEYGLKPTDIGYQGRVPFGHELYDYISRDQIGKEIDLALGNLPYVGKAKAINKEDTPLISQLGVTMDELLDVYDRDTIFQFQQELASRYLDSKGIKGIKFPAEGRTLNADGTIKRESDLNNYVIFDNKALDIAKKYAVPFATTLGGIAVTAAPQEAEAGIWTPLMSKGSLILRPADIGYDSRFLVKGSGKTGFRGGELERANALTVGVESRGTQRADVFNWEDAIGRGYVLGEADRTMAGGLITSINGVKLNFPVDMRGGQGFPLDTAGYGWASDKGAVTGLIGKLTEASKGTGKNPLMLPFTMAPSGGDFAPFNGNIMLSYANAAMDKKTKKALDAAIKKIDKTWVGVDSPMQQVWFDSADPKVRGQIVNLLDRDFRNKGGFSLGEARLSVTAPEQLNAADASLQSVIEIDLVKGVAGRQHPAYNTTMYGQSLGRADRGSAFDIAGDYVNKGGERFGDKWPSSGQEFNALQGKAKTDANYTLLRTKPYGLITEKIAERLSNAPVAAPSAGLLALIGAAGANADARPMPIAGGQLKNTVRNAVFGAPQAQIPAGFYNQTGGIGVAQAPAQNPVSQGAEYVARKLHSGARNLQNAGILSMLSSPLASLGDIASRAAYGESKVTDPAEALLNASAFAPQLYFGGKTLNAMRDKDMQSMLFRQIFGD